MQPRSRAVVTVLAVAAVGGVAVALGLGGGGGGRAPGPDAAPPAPAAATPPADAEELVLRRGDVVDGGVDSSSALPCETVAAELHQWLDALTEDSRHRAAAPPSVQLAEAALTRKPTASLLLQLDGRSLRLGERAADVTGRGARERMAAIVVEALVSHGSRPAVALAIDGETPVEAVAMLLELMAQQGVTRTELWFRPTMRARPPERSTIDEPLAQAIATTDPAQRRERLGEVARALYGRCMNLGVAVAPVRATPAGQSFPAIGAAARAAMIDCACYTDWQGVRRFLWEMTASQLVVAVEISLGSEQVVTAAPDATWAEVAEELRRRGADAPVTLKLSR